jgi:RND family efflux transporter MFP subunit
MDPGRGRFLVIVAGVLLVALVAGILHGRRAPRPVPVVTVARALFVIDLPESGIVQYPEIQTISAQTAGNIGRIFVRPGDRVRGGQLLATIENPQVTANAAGTAAAYRSASARAESASVTGGSNVVQAEANLEAARTRLAQADQDLANGLQPGAGYGQSTAAEQRAQVEANLTTATTNLREAQRMYFAYRQLESEKAVSRDQLDQTEAKYEQAKGLYNQARLAYASLGDQLTRSHEVLEDNVRSAQEGVAQAQAQLATARIESSGGDVAAARAEASESASEYALAREQSEAMRIHAPYDATVLTVAPEKDDPLRPLQPGDAVGSGQAILTLAAHGGFIVRTRVDEQDIIDVRLGQRARITGEDFPGQTLSGRVAEISPIAQRTGEGASSSRTVATTIAIDQSPPFLRDGMGVNVAILTTELPRAIFVPSDAILRDATETYVFVVRDGIARRQIVRVGMKNETEAVIVAGLRPGDVIVALDVAGLRDGDAVSIATSASRSPL